MIKPLIVAVFFTLLGFGTHADILTTPVNDSAHILNENEYAELVLALNLLRTTKDVWMVVHTVPSLNGLDIETYSNQYFQRFEIGQRGKDNGLLLVVAINDRKMRLEVGYGLEGSIPDNKAKEILDEILRPALKDKKYFGGIRDVVNYLQTTSIEIQKPGFTKEPNKNQILIGYFSTWSAIVGFILVCLSQLYQLNRTRIEMSDLNTTLFVRLSETPESRKRIVGYIRFHFLLVILKTIVTLLIVYFLCGLISYKDPLLILNKIFYWGFNVVFPLVVSAILYPFLDMFRLFFELSYLTVVARHDTNFVVQLKRWRTDSGDSVAQLQHIYESSGGSGGSGSSGGGSFSGGGSSGGGGASSGW